MLNVFPAKGVTRAAVARPIKALNTARTEASSMFVSSPAPQRFAIDDA